MKKIVFFSAFALLMISVYGQKSVDRLFEKYSGRDGYTTFSISGNLLNLAATFDDEDEGERDRDINARITGVRILAQKDKSFTADNFFDIVRKDLNISDYEELMSLRETDQDMKMYVRSEGRRISELLIVAGGKDNALIQIKGDMTMSDARRLAQKARHNHGVAITTE